MTIFQGKSIVDADDIVFSHDSRGVIRGLTLSISAGEISGLLAAFGASLLAAGGATLRRT